MKELKPFIVSLAFVTLLWAGVAHAAPWYQFSRTILPVDSTENIGTSTAKWDEGWFNSINVGSCTGCSGGFPWPFTKQAGGEQATSTIMQFIGGMLSNASSTFTVAPTFSSLTSALVQTGAGGLTAEYTGTSCTNQFPRSLSALGIATCASVALGTDISGTLAVANGGTGITSFATGIATWLGSGTAADLRTLTVGTTGSGNLVFATAPTVSGLVTDTVDTGQGANELYDMDQNVLTTSNVTFANASTTNLNVSQNHITLGSVGAYVSGTTTPAFNIASSTLDALGNSFNRATTSLILANYPETRAMRSFWCVASSTGSVIVRFGDGTNWTEAGNCTTTGKQWLTPTNNLWNPFENFMVEIGTSATNPSRVTITPVMNKLSD